MVEEIQKQKDKEKMSKNCDNLWNDTLNALKNKSNA